MINPNETHPIACTLDQEDFQQRGDTWRSMAASALRAKVATPSGVHLDFEPGPATAHSLLDLVMAERSCCAWASWTLTSTTEATLVEVGAEGPGAAVLQEMFELTP